MIKTEKKMYETNTVSEIICNVCERKLETNEHGYYEDFVHIDKLWGYTSNNDGKEETVDICEKCWGKLKETFKIKP
jgi:hypothetical protein